MGCWTSREATRRKNKKMTNNNIPRVERREIRMIVPHKNGEAIFIHPSQEPHNYQTVGRGIIARGLNVPTGEYNASLLYSAYCSEAKDEPEFKEVRDYMGRGWLWTFNHNIWTPEGLYVVTDPKAEGLSKDFSVAQLERRLKRAKELSFGGIRMSKNGSVRFAPVGSYEFGVQDDLSTQGDVIANYTLEGAKKLAEVGSTFISQPRTGGVEVSKDGTPVHRVASLYSSDVWLHVDGSGWGGGDDGYAFGVSK